MKKAYVKPVFFAEEFAGTSSVAACEYNAKQNALQIWEGRNLCLNGKCAHEIGKKTNEVSNWWDYATNTEGADANKPSSDSLSGYNDGAYLFTDGQTVCDFVWNTGGSQVGIWTSAKDDSSTAIWDDEKRTGTLGVNLFVTLITAYSNFFGIEPDKSDQHLPGVNNEVFFS